MATGVSKLEFISVKFEIRWKEIRRTNAPVSTRSFLSTISDSEGFR